MDDEDEELLSEIKALRNDFKEYQKYSKRESTQRRVENIQVLVSLGVIGGAITIFSSESIQSQFWQNIITTPYWNLVLKIFLISNILFLSLKLITIPLRHTWDSELILTIHEFWEPFLYFFAVLGGIISMAIGLSSDFLPAQTTIFGLNALALVAYSLPALIGFLIGQANRIISIAYRTQLVMYDINKVVEQTAEIQVELIEQTLEQHTEIINELVVLAGPSPILIDILFKLLDVSEKHMPILAEEIDAWLDEFVERHSSAVSVGAAPIGGVVSALTFFIIRKQIKDRYSESEQKEIQEQINDLRKKAKQKELTEEDLEKLKELIESQENGENS